MKPETINLICSAVALLAGLVVFGLYALKRRAKPTDETFEADAESVIRNYSIYIDGAKVGTCFSAGLLLDSEETQLTFNQIVPMSAPHFRKLQSAFRNRERLSVAIGPIDQDVLQLGEMRVTVLLLDADMQSCSTRLQTTLSGPTLVQPIAFKEPVATPDSIAAAFNAIEFRAERAQEAVDAL